MVSKADESSFARTENELGKAGFVTTRGSETVDSQCVLVLALANRFSSSVFLSLSTTLIFYGVVPRPFYRELTYFACAIEKIKRKYMHPTIFGFRDCLLARRRVQVARDSHVYVYTCP